MRRAWVVASWFSALAGLVQAQGPVINPASLPEGEVGIAYSVTLTVTGGTGTWTVSAGLPPGLTFAGGTGTTTTISGTPTTAGSFTFTVQRGSAIRTYRAVTIYQQLIITTASPLTPDVAGTSYSQTFTATGGSDTPYTWSFVSGSLPPGTTFADSGDTGLLSGTLTVGGTYDFTIRVRDGAGFSVTKTFTQLIYDPVSITTPSPLPAGAINAPYSRAFAATGGEPDGYIWTLTVGQFPPGLSLKGDTLSGTPTQLGTSTFTMRASNGSRGSNFADKQFTLEIVPPVTITTGSLGGGVVGAAYSQTLAATGGTGPPYVWSILNGALPPGVTLSASAGTLSGTPTSAGTYSFTLVATAAVSGIRAFNLTVGNAGTGFLASTGALNYTGFVGGDNPPTQYFAVVSTTGSALQFSAESDSTAPKAAGPTWLTLLQNRGVTPSRIGVAVNTAGLTPGQYAAQILITAGTQQVTVTVNLTLTDKGPSLEIAPSALRFSGPKSALSPGEQLLIVRNGGGGGVMPFRASVRGQVPWLALSPANGQTIPNTPALVRVIVNATNLEPKAYFAEIEFMSDGGTAVVPVTLLVTQGGPAIGLSASGVRFEARAGNGHNNPKTIDVLNAGERTVNWQAELLNAAAWLSIEPRSGSATPAAPSRLLLSANPGSLQPGAYYALVRITDPGANNSPQYLVAVLNVVPSTALPLPELSPEGLVFRAPTGAAPPPSQEIRLSTSSASTISFQAAANTANLGDWLQVTPAQGPVSTGQPATLIVSANPRALPPGIYTGDITATFSNTSVRTTNVTFIVQPQGTVNAMRAAAGCLPAKLAVTQSGLVNNFSAPASWPTPVAVRVFDDCADPVTNAQVVATFSNGDPALTLRASSSQAGLYTGTWSPGRVLSPMTITARAAAPNLGTTIAELTGNITPNRAPSLSRNGTLNNLYPVVGAPLAPGTVAAVFGSELAPSAVSPGVLPLVPTFNGTQVIVGGLDAPLYYLSPGQLNIQLPTELVPDREHAILAAANGAYTLPDTLVFTPVRPGVAAFVDGRVIAQHGDYTLVQPDAPARPGEVLTLYLVGMGPTDPAVKSGQPSPGGPLATAMTKPVVTIGGREAELFFYGLTPGAVGLYQINPRVPVDAASGDLEIIVTQAGVAANTTTLPVRR